MPPRPPNRNVSSPLRPAPNAPYHPPTDTATYRDLLLFEERLKSNAEMLRRRRRRYMIFLWSFVAVLGCMGHKLVIHPPDNTLLLRALQASVAVVSITLVLFFASGMYEEKIRYAHSYINHSNKSLRPLNMHLNMRRALPFPFSLPFFPSALRPASASASRRPSVSPLTTPSPTSFKPSLPGKNLPSTVSASKSRRPSVTPNVMATIPPSSNPRGELIFSSRVDRSFREGYERYRSAFERRREEKQRAARAERGWFWFLYGDTGVAGGGRGVSPSPSVGSVSSGSSKRRSETPSPSGTTRTLTPVSGREHRRSLSPSTLGVELGLKAE